jgi:hypothetical protein
LKNAGAKVGSRGRIQQFEEKKLQFVRKRANWLNINELGFICLPSV